jgi:hypothetical protein
MSKEIITLTQEQKYKMYIKWYCQDPDARPPKDTFKKKYNIDEEDILSFEIKDTFPNDVDKEIRNWAKSKLPELLHLSYKRIKDLSNNKKLEELKLFKELTSEPEKKDNANVFNFNMLGISDDKFQKMQKRSFQNSAPLLEEK